MNDRMVSRADGSLQNLFGLQDIAETISGFATEEQKSVSAAVLRGEAMGRT